MHHSYLLHLLPRLSARRTRPVMATCALLGASVVVAPAHAQSADPATAESVFSRGVADMMAGHYQSGCPAIQQSHRLDPRPGTLFTLAECEAKWGRIASAVAHYDEYQRALAQLPASRRETHKEREQIASRQQSKLAPEVPKLTLRLPGDAPKGLVVRRDGESVEALGTPQPVDPGVHVISVSLPAGPTQEVSITIQRGESKQVDLPIPREANVPLSPAAVTPEVPRHAPSSSPTQSSGGKHGSGRRTAAYVAGGIGAAGMVSGVVLGVIALGKKKTANSECSGTACNSSGMDAVDSGRSWATASNIGFGLGVAGLATSAILLLTQPKEKASSAIGRSRWQPVIGGQTTSEAMVGVSGVW